MIWFQNRLVWVHMLFWRLLAFPKPLETNENISKTYRSLWGLCRGSGKIKVLGSSGVWGRMFIVIVEKSVAHKLRRIILFHFGLVFGRCHFPKIWKVLIFLIFGPSGRGHGPHTPMSLNLFWILIRQTNSNNPRKYQVLSEKLCFLNLTILKIEHFEMEKMRAGESWRSVQ